MVVKKKAHSLSPLKFYILEHSRKKKSSLYSSDYILSPFMEQKQIQIQKQDKTEKRRKSETEWLEEKRIVDNEPDKVKNLIQML